MCRPIKMCAPLMTGCFSWSQADKLLPLEHIRLPFVFGASVFALKHADFRCEKTVFEECSTSYKSASTLWEMGDPNLNYAVLYAFCPVAHHPEVTLFG